MIMKRRLYLKLSNRCNANCSYCFQGENHKGAITNEEVVGRTIRRLINSYQEVFLFGGEPFLDVNVNSIKAILELSEKNNIYAFTNGYFGDASRALLLNNSNAFRSIIISIDGPRDVHNSRRPIRGMDGYGRIIENIHFLVSASIACHVQINIDTDNICQVDETVDLINEEFHGQVPITLNRVLHSSKTISMKVFLEMLGKYKSETGKKNVFVNSNALINLECHKNNKMGEKCRCHISDTIILDFETHEITCCPENTRSKIGLWNKNYALINPVRRIKISNKPQRRIIKCIGCQWAYYCEYGCSFEDIPENCKSIAEENYSIANIILEGKNEV